MIVIKLSTAVAWHCLGCGELTKEDRLAVNMVDVLLKYGATRITHSFSAILSVLLFSILKVMWCCKHVLL